MDFSWISQIFSRRRIGSDKVIKPLTPEFRERVLMLCTETFSGYRSLSNAPGSSDFWSDIHTKLKFSRGRSTLTNRPVTSKEEDAVNFLFRCSDEHFLDFVELIFKFRFGRNPKVNNAGLVKNVNEFFDVDGLPYRLTDLRFSPVRKVHPSTIGLPVSDPEAYINASTEEAYPQVICKEDEILHQQAISPTLLLLTEPHFTSANEEFLEALSHYRKGEYRDCALKCGNSFESVMKVICDRKQWPYQQTDTAAKLLKTILETDYFGVVL